MKIRIKITLVVLPLMILFLLLAGLSSYFTAVRGINRVTHNFLNFKSTELEKFSYSQWQLLVDSNRQGQEEMVMATRASIEQYSRSIIRSDTESIISLSRSGQLMMKTGGTEGSKEEIQDLLDLLKDEQTLQSPTFNFIWNGEERVAKGFYFPPYDNYYIISESYEVFFRDIDRITTQTIVFSIVSTLLAALLLFILSSTLTRPLNHVVDTMKEIILSGDLDRSVPIKFNDEIGQLAQTFNLMVKELNKAQKNIKNYALKAVLAQKNEMKIRNIFQKYVPQDLIDQFFKNPESMLVGDTRKLSILFSDIRSFTTISENMKPDELVHSLNDYFSVMVDLILQRNGIVDKYIGDAIMAFYGAPVAHQDDALQSVHSALDMMREVKDFNHRQVQNGRPEFRIGIGINYGDVTVGNIGTDKKMDYTVIGDSVNLASRLEGLTKEYKTELVISEFLQKEIEGSLMTRLLDVVAVKGKKSGVKIYTVADKLEGNQARAWELHNQAMKAYLARDFQKAIEIFEQVQTLLTGDFLSISMMQRCSDYIKHPPEQDWDGVKVMKTK